MVQTLLYWSEGVALFSLPLPFFTQWPRPVLLFLCLKLLFSLLVNYSQVPRRFSLPLIFSSGEKTWLSQNSFLPGCRMWMCLFYCVYLTPKSQRRFRFLNSLIYRHGFSFLLKNLREFLVWQNINLCCDTIKLSSRARERITKLLMKKWSFPRIESQQKHSSLCTEFA